MNPLVGAIKICDCVLRCLRIRNSWDTSENIWLELYYGSSIHFNDRYVTFCSFDNDQGAINGSFFIILLDITLEWRLI